MTTEDALTAESTYTGAASRYLSVEEIISIHRVVAEDASIRDHALLASAASRPQSSFAGAWMYPTVFMQGAALFSSILSNHPFTDGNKRTAWLSVQVFFRLNGLLLERISDEDVVDMVVSSITESASVEMLAERFQKLAGR